MGHVMIDVTTPEGRKELLRLYMMDRSQMRVAEMDALDYSMPALLDYIDELEAQVRDQESNWFSDNMSAKLTIEELEERCEELTEMLTDVPRRYIERMRDDV